MEMDGGDSILLLPGTLHPEQATKSSVKIPRGRGNRLTLFFPELDIDTVRGDELSRIYRAVCNGIE